MVASGVLTVTSSTYQPSRWIVESEVTLNARRIFSPANADTSSEIFWKLPVESGRLGLPPLLVAITVVPLDVITLIVAVS